MANLAYLKDSGPSKRLRFVKPGYDATDESVPNNKVIFDSGCLGTVAVLETGQYTWQNFDPFTIPLTKVRSWDYGFVPLCIFQWSIGAVRQSNSLYVADGNYSQLVESAIDGIYVKFNLQNFSKVTDPVVISWVAFSIDARDGQ